MRRLALVLLVFLLTTPALAQEALKPDDTISGSLRFFRHQHPNGTRINVYQITVDHPRKFAEADEFCDPKNPPVTFHILVMDDKAKKAQLDWLLGKKITVVGDQFFCPETAWHIDDAVLSQWHFPGRR